MILFIVISFLTAYPFYLVCELPYTLLSNKLLSARKLANQPITTNAASGNAADSSKEIDEDDSDGSAVRLNNGYGFNHGMEKDSDLRLILDGDEGDDTESYSCSSSPQS